MDQTNNTASPLEQLATQQSVPLPPPMPSSPFMNVDPNTPVSLKLPVSAFTRQQPRASALDTPGVKKLGGPAFLAQILDDPEKQGYIIEVRRTGPAVWENQHLPAGVIERLTPMAYPELYRRVLEGHGGGEYRVVVMDESGVMKTQFPFIIDTVMTAPKFKLPNTVALFGTAPNNGFRPTPMNANFAAIAGTAAEPDEILKIREAERKTVAEHQLLRTKQDLRRTEKQIAEEERAEQERRERQAQAPVDRMDQRMQQLEMFLMKQDGGGSSKTLEMMNQNFQNMMTLMMESNKQSREDAQRRSDEQFKMLTLLFSQKGSGSSDVAEAAKLAAEANKQMMTMAMETAKSGNQKFEKLFETVMVQKLTQSDSQENKAFEWMERGRRQTLEMLEIRDRYSDRDADEEGWNPEAGVIGNVGRMVFKFLSDAMKNGGGGLLSQWISQHTQKPTTQVTNQDLLSLAHNVEQGRIAAPPMTALGVGNPPAQPQVQQQYAPATMAQPIPTAQRPVTPPPVVAVNPPPVVVPPPAPTPPVELYEVQQAVQQVYPTATVTVAVEQTDDAAAQRLREYVNEALEIACADLEDGRREHEWSNFALDKWPMYFLDQLLTAPDDGARIQLIQTHADPDLFQRLVTLISTAPSAQHNYAMFMLALQNMLMEHRQAKVVPLNAAS